MAFLINERRLNSIKYVCKRDEAIDWEASDRDLYEQDPIKNFGALKYLPGKEPVIFLLNFELSGKEASWIRNSQINGQDSEKNPKLALGDWALMVARLTLKDIQYPAGETPYVEFKKEGKGYVQDAVLDKLERIDVIQEIWSLYVSLTADKNEVKGNAKN